MLYDPLLQRRIENESWPSLNGRYLAFAYPPYVAQILSPFGALDARPAKFLFMVMMSGFLIGAWTVARRWLPAVAERPWIALALLLCFPPFTAAILGGQNTSLSLLLSIAITALLWEEGAEPLGRRALAGMLLGLWLFKPHFALFSLLPLTVAFGIPVLIGFGAVAAVLYFISALQFGAGWPFYWLDQATQFSAADTVANQHQMVSLVAAVQAMLSIAAPQEESSVGAIASVGLALIGSVLLCVWIYRNREEKGAGRKLLLLLSPAVVLLSPHTMFYDCALCLPALVYFWRPKNDADVVAVIVFFIFSFACVSARELLAFQPLVIIPLITLLLIVMRPSRELA